MNAKNFMIVAAILSLARTLFLMDQSIHLGTAPLYNFVAFTAIFTGLALVLHQIEKLRDRL